jgi:hypothetical protein
MKLPQLSLRDLFWLVLVCALALGWWLEHRRHARDAETIEALNLQRDSYMQRAEQLLEGVQQLEAAARQSESNW